MRVFVLLAVAQVADSLRALNIANASQHSSSLCIDGHLAPELVVLGAAKTSTTLLKRNLAYNSKICFPGWSPGKPEACGSGLGQKELHFFDGRGSRQLLPESNHRLFAERHNDAGKAYWLSYYPTCDESARFVAVDISPRYLTDDHAPKRIVSYYGAYLNKVTFVAILREPVSAFTSFYYFRGGQQSSFQSFVSGILDRPEARHDRRFLNELYAEALERYFAKVNPRQFLICPMDYNTQEKRGYPVFTKFLQTHLGIEPQKHEQAQQDAVEEALVHNHPSAQESLDKKTYQKLFDLFDALAGPRRLAKVLAANKPEDAPLLYGYENSSDDENAIADWLQDGWTGS